MKKTADRAVKEMNINEFAPLKTNKIMTAAACSSGMKLNAMSYCKF